MRLTINDLFKKQQTGEKITCLTAYDASFARIMDDLGIDIILIGDSLGMVIQGLDNTINVRMKDMIYHTQCVSNAVNNALIMVDMPFLSCRTADIALKNAGKLLQAGADMVKIEAGEEMFATMTHLSKQFIPICAHIGLKPQQIKQLGGYHKQGGNEKIEEKIINDSIAAARAGADIILLECVYPDIAKKVSKQSNKITIGIGSGKHCHGQILLSTMSSVSPNAFLRLAVIFTAK